MAAPARIARSSLCVFCRHLRVQPRPRSQAQRLRSPRNANQQHPRLSYSTITSTNTPLQPDTSPQSSNPTPKTTYFSLFPQTYPNGPPPTGKFSCSPRSLRNEFLKLQQAHHPDLQSQNTPSSPTSSSSNSTTLEERTSSYINNAYRTLLDPLSRAEYILELNGIESRGEADKIDGGEFLMEVMEFTEMIEELPSPLPDEARKQLDSLKEENESRKEECVAEIEGLLERGEWDEAKDAVVRLRYWYMVGTRITERL